MTLLFLIAYWLYIDGVGTVIRMAVDYGTALGFNSNDLIKALLLTQFVGFPAALAYGWLGTKIGAKRGILIAIVVYLGVVIWASQMTQRWEFYGIATVIGLVQGGIQALSRSYFSRLVPQGHAGEFFGFFNMLGKFAAVIGPLLMGIVALMSGDIRLSMLGLSVLFIAGGALLLMVDDEAARKAAREL